MSFFLHFIGWVKKEGDTPPINHLKKMAKKLNQINFRTIILINFNSLLLTKMIFTFFKFFKSLSSNILGFSILYILGIKF